MKITSTPEALDELGKQNLRRMRANLGCNRCPYCGETRDDFNSSFSKDGKLHGIESGIVNHKWIPGKFFHRNELDELHRLRIYDPGHFIHTDCYECHECGTKWESDPW